MRRPTKKPTKAQVAASLELQRPRRVTYLRCSRTYEAVVRAEEMVHAGWDDESAARTCAEYLELDGPTVLHYLRERIDATEGEG